MKFYLSKRDEYGQVENIANSSSLEELQKKALACVEEDNMQNALTSDEQINNFESYAVVLKDKDGNNVNNAFYGRNEFGKDVAIVNLAGGVNEIPLESTEVLPYIYIGTKSKDRFSKEREPLYLEKIAVKINKELGSRSTVKETITSLKDTNVIGKSFYYIRQVRA